MKHYWMDKMSKIIVLVALAVAAFGAVVMALWNWLMPTIFSLPEITFWQALGLLILSWILLGGFRGPGHRHRHHRRRIAERWAQMSPEEQEKFREKMRHHWHHHKPNDDDKPE